MEMCVVNLVSEIHVQSDKRENILIVRQFLALVQTTNCKWLDQVLHT
jgi:hypothetical protein